MRNIHACLYVRPSDQTTLARLVADGTTPQKIVARARIGLLSGRGLGTNAIQREARVSKPTVWRWQKAYMDGGVERLLKAKMAEVLCIYREVKIIKETAAAAKQKPSDAVAIVSYDEKPGVQAIATTAPDLPPEPGVHATFAREFEYKRHGTVSLLAGIDLVSGKVHALVRDRHRSREFIEFLKLLDAAYPTPTAMEHPWARLFPSWVQDMPRKDAIAMLKDRAFRDQIGDGLPPVPSGGLDNVQGEWSLVTMAWNMKRMYVLAAA
jgi:Homeodomain-like domain